MSEVRLPKAVEVVGARTHNLRNVDVDVPLWSLVMLTGLSGSGKSSLAMGVLYGEGSRRYLDGLSAYTRRRIGQVARPDVDRVDFLPSALALRQRPPVPGRRSTVGTMTEVLNVVRLMFSRLGRHVCPNGHRIEPNLARSAQLWLDCPVCGVHFEHPSAESFSFNTLGRCPGCDGLGVRDEIDTATLIPDDSLSVIDGAVAPWNLAGRSYMPQVAADLGVRIDVPVAELTDAERAILLDGPPEPRLVTLTSKAGRAVSANMTYESARRAVQNAATKTTSETTRQRLSRFFSTHTCPVCQGSRLRPEALTTTLSDRDIAQVSTESLDALADFAKQVTVTLPAEMRPLSDRLAVELTAAVEPLRRLGIGYLSLDRAGATLSTGERQRIELASTLQARSTGMLYVLDEPSVGLHPANVDGLRAVLRGLVAAGNSVVVVDHDVALLREADHLIEMGPGAGRQGGTVVSQGSAADLAACADSVTGPYLSGSAGTQFRTPRPIGTAPHRTDTAPRRTDTAPHPTDTAQRSIDIAAALEITVGELYTLRNVSARIPLRRLTVVTGVSGSGKTALVLDSLVPALTADVPPSHVRRLERAGIRAVVEVDATPIGNNSRSTPVTYCGALDPIRRWFAKESGRTAAHFSYNTAAGQCPTCLGLGELDLDIQYLPDLTVGCPDCHGARYNPEVRAIIVDGLTIADVLSLTVAEAVDRFAAHPKIVAPLRAVRDVGLGYLCLGEPTPSLSGGEAQRLRLATALRSEQADTLYVFDEPSIGLHPNDVRTLLTVLDRLIDAGATVLVIDHDLDVIANADHIIDLGPGGGPDGGRIVATGTPAEIAAASDSRTGYWLGRHLAGQ
ncbi:putative UvrABC system protein A [Nocardia brasiliensis NBRC 14402]|uniref:excinuclease ABC subunit UvrA n=1 Tax=Nocardia brasiliensis TaxID=37326 RepID=UPI00045C5AB1|nr:excinuclease ABC subunit UvrA [Nocardia brasiliensis]ASF09138.1 excinuclease ABC subunit UvrA [Nocardia brasiliensis]GAJ83915.1 putative UvrABC system protein A [Nocardia brasiliensis NBRC 14402]SUB40226.1 Excinuclease ABC subunit A [Nocardia brasiliensis]